MPKIKTIKKNKVYDNNYFNTSISVDKSDNVFRKDMRFYQVRTTPILDKPSDYYLTIVRFMIPSFSIPLLIFPIQDNQANANLSIYSITLEYDGDAQQVFLIYEPTLTTAAVPSTAIPTQEISSYYFVFQYQTILNFINTAFETAFGNLSSPPLNSTFPYITYDTSTKLFSLVAEKAFYDLNSVATPIKIYMNRELNMLFAGMPGYVNILTESGNTTDGKDVQLIVSDNGNNLFNPPGFNDDPPEFLNMIQEYNSTPNWRGMRRLVFLSDSIPINSETISLNSNTFLNILLDFEPDVSSDEDTRSILQYSPSLYRLVDLTSDAPMSSFGFSVYWEDIHGDLRILEVPFNQQASVKFGFIKKSLYNNDVS